MDYQEDRAEFSGPEISDMETDGEPTPPPNGGGPSPPEELEEAWAPILSAVDRLLVKPDARAYNDLIAAVGASDDHPLYPSLLRLASALVKAFSQPQFTAPSPVSPPPLPPRGPDPEELACARDQAVLEFWEALLPTFLEAHRLASLQQQRRRWQPEELWRALATFLAAVEAWGFRPVGSVGERVAYTPSRHRPCSSETVVQEGDPVVIDTVGVERNGRVLRPALVRTV